MLPQSADWISVVPKPGCAIVNLGDGALLSIYFQEPILLNPNPRLVERLERKN